MSFPDAEKFSGRSGFALGAVIFALMLAGVNSAQPAEPNRSSQADNELFVSAGAGASELLHAPMSADFPRRTPSHWMNSGETVDTGALAGLTNAASTTKTETAKLEPQLSDLSIGLDATNPVPSAAPSKPQLGVVLRAKLEEARGLRYKRQPADAEPILIELLAEESPVPLQQAALLELALAAQEQNQPARAEQIYGQFVNKWPNDLRIPEILLREGQLFRQMGMNTMALAKYYGVMTSALVLKNDRMEHYQKTVRQAQLEVAETHYLTGKYADAADFYSRLLKQNTPTLNRARIQFRLVSSLAALDRSDEVVGQGQDFLSRFPEAPEQPEVRFHVALALKKLGRNAESLEQVLTLLREQKALTYEHPELWGYWQQRAGNAIANQFYREGDYAKALEVYLGLAQLDRSPAWQVPVSYQIGMTYERLLQPQKAAETYSTILARQAEMGTNASPGLKAVFDMARWRTNFIHWEENAERVNRSIRSRPPTNSVSTASVSQKAEIGLP